jgi:hypothetical protein
MNQQIKGYHIDAIGDWVAELACGHCQHVRHKPPWINRPWVTSEAGRRSMIDELLGCKKCDEGVPADRW